MKATRKVHHNITILWSGLIAEEISMLAKWLHFAEGRVVCQKQFLEHRDGRRETRDGRTSICQQMPNKIGLWRGQEGRNGLGKGRYRDEASGEHGLGSDGRLRFPIEISGSQRIDQALDTALGLKSF